MILWAAIAILAVCVLTLFSLSKSQHEAMGSLRRYAEGLEAQVERQSERHWNNRRDIDLLAQAMGGELVDRQPKREFVRKGGPERSE